MTQTRDAFHWPAGLRLWRGGGIALISIVLGSFVRVSAETAIIAAPVATPPAALVWNPPDQYYTATNGTVGARFTFKVRNISASDYVVNDIRTSCDCTTAGIPSRPWRLAPGETSKMEAVVDLRDHMRGVTSSDIVLKEIYVVGVSSTNTLSIAITIPPGLTNIMTQPEMDRIWGQQLAAVDHQAVFKTTCVTCHLRPAFGKTGGNLYHTACGICHDDAQRAPMVPDLHVLKTEIDTNYWRTWISYGKAGTLMPGFINTEGGPLEAAQVDSLVNYMTNAFPRPIKGLTNSLSK